MPHEQLPRVIDISSQEAAEDPAFSARAAKNRDLLDALHPAAAAPLATVSFDIIDDPKTEADHDDNTTFYHDLLKSIGPDHKGKRVSAHVKIVQGEQHDIEFAEGNWRFQGSFANPSTPVILVCTKDRDEQGTPRVSHITGYQAGRLPEDLRQLYDQKIRKA